MNPLALAAASLFALSAAQAQTVTLPAGTLPTGPSVVRGQATVSSTGTAMTVTNANNTILNWRSFSIGARGRVEFVQPNAQSQVLNRVTGNDPSQIFGNLQSNGRVWLLNPNGVLFGKGSRIDVAGLVASTLNVNDADWQAGKYSLTNSLAGGDKSSVINEGDLRTPLGGRIALIGGSGGVINRGAIDAPGGQVLLAAGNSVDLIDTGAPNITLRVPAPLGTVENGGTGSVRGGRIDAQAAIVNQQGFMSADALGTGSGGEIVLRASQRAVLGVESVTTADAYRNSDGEGGSGNGGRIVVHGDAQALVRGSLSARSGDVAGNGGSIETSGALLDVQAQVDAGADKGRAGTWLAQGANVVVANAGSIGVTGAPSVAGPIVSAASVEAALDSGTHVRIVADGIGLPAGVPAGNIGMAGVQLGPVPRNDVQLSFEAASNIAIANSSIVNDGASVGLSLNAASGGSEGVVLLQNTRIDLTGRNSTVGIDAPVALLSSSSVFAGGRIDVAADRLGLLTIGDSDSFTSLFSAAAGDAVVVRGRNGDGLSQFVNNSGSDVLGAPEGRWLVYAARPNSGDTAPLRDLPYAFSQHGASFAERRVVNGNIGTPQAGNGLLFAADAGQVQFAGMPIKTYDGNTAGALLPSAISVSSGLLAGERALFGITVRGNYDNRNAGDRGFTLAPDAVRFVDAQGRPVYGYENNLGTLQGRIDRAPLTLLGATAADRAYNGTTAAQIGAVAFAGLVGNEQLSATAAAAFTDANAGTGKLVSGNVTGLSDGASGGLAGNYVLRGSTAFTSRAAISPALLTVQGAVAADRAYDGSTATQITSVSLGGLVGSEQLGVAAVGAFADANAGTGKVVNGIVGGLSNGANGGLASNYALSGNAFTTSATISPALLTVQNAVAADRVYDGSTAAQIGAVTFGGLVGSEQLGFTASGAFADANAGTGKPVNGNVSGLSDGANGGLASNYVLRGNAFTTSATISPALLTVQSAVAADRVYDGSTAAQITAVSLGGLVGSQQLGVTASGAFADANADTAKLVRGNVTALSDGANGGLASNYAFDSNAFTTSATISPATLTYLADAAAWTLPATTPPLSGTVGGFVGGETLASATTGALQFTAPAGALAAPGTYAVQGSGLSARNYTIVQAPGNASALTVAPEPVVLPERADRPLPNTVFAAYGGPSLFPQPPTQPTSTTGRALDVSQWLQVNTAAGTSTFAAVPVADLSQDSLSSLLSARDRYKARVFAEALEQLEREPTLADSPDCKTPQQIETGTCLITETLKREMAARSGVTQAEAAPTPTPTPAPAAAETPRVAAAPVADPLPSFAAKRRVKAATLPQIERKVAVLIGIDDYTDARIPKLANAAGDARAVGALLEGKLGYETVVLANAGKAQIIRTLNTLAATLGPKDSIVVYYAGHGQLVSGTGLGYWQVGDADAADAKSWLSNADIGKLISRLGASQVALVSDSCFSGSLVSDERIRPLAGGADAGTLLSRRAAVVMSSGGNEPVFDAGKNGHSPFAFSLMQTLQGVPTWQAGGNVFERVRFAVARELPQRPRYGAAVAGGHEAGSDYLFERRELE